MSDGKIDLALGISIAREIFEAVEARRALPSVVTDAMVSAAVEAAWPGKEIVYADEFDGPASMMRAALEAALAIPSENKL